MKTGTITNSVLNLASYVDERTCDNVLFERKIKDVTSDLIPSFQKLLYKISKENAWTIANYIISMKIEVNLADNYRRNIIKELAHFSIFCNNKSFKHVTRNEWKSKLNTHMRDCEKPWEKNTCWNYLSDL